jgi:hypothetical protein
MTDFNVAAEGDLDAAVARRLIEETGHVFNSEYVTGGKSALDSRLRAYNSAARFSSWLVMRDLDHDASCPAELLGRLLPARSQGLLLRIPVREVEAWLLADRVGVARFLGVSQALVATDPENIAEPKLALVNLAARSRKRDIREGIPPRTGSGRSVGPEYNSLLSRFVQSEWSIVRAIEREASLSLTKALDRLSNHTPPQA